MKVKIIWIGRYKFEEWHKKLAISKRGCKTNAEYEQTS